MRRVGTFIFGRPRRLPRDRRAVPTVGTYTLICEEPEVEWQGSARPRSVCRLCQERSPAQESREWRLRAVKQASLSTMAELEVAQLSARLVVAEKKVARLQSQLQVTSQTGDLPLHWYVRDKGSRAAHQLDFERETLDHALCGRPFSDIVTQGEDRPRAVCRACQERLDCHGKRWWQQQAATAQQARIAAEKAHELVVDAKQRQDRKVANQRRALAGLTGSRAAHWGPPRRQRPLPRGIRLQGLGKVGS